MVCPYAAAWFDTNRFFSACHDTHYKAVLLARLVEAEIVSPYCGIPINTGVGIPTVMLS